MMIDTRTLVELFGGRPENSPGWSMLQAKTTRTLRGPGGETIEVKAGQSRVHRSHWAIRLHPGVFQVVDKRDTRTQRDHGRALKHVRQDLERGRPAGRTATRAGVLPPRTSGSALRLPGGGPSGARPLRLPR